MCAAFVRCPQTMDFFNFHCSFIYPSSVVTEPPSTTTASDSGVSGRKQVTTPALVRAHLWQGASEREADHQTWAS